MNKSTQMWLEEELTVLNKKFQESIEIRTEKAKIRAEEINQRITKLDQKFEEEKAIILKQIDDRGRELREMLEKFKVYIKFLINYNYYTLVYSLTFLFNLG